MLPWPSDCSIRRLTRALVISARITVLRVTPATIRSDPEDLHPGRLVGEGEVAEADRGEGLDR